jgi:hypothetical protein
MLGPLGVAVDHELAGGTCLGPWRERRWGLRVADPGLAAPGAGDRHGGLWSGSVGMEIGSLGSTPEGVLVPLRWVNNGSAGSNSFFSRVSSWERL